jgi:hypothetical protein
MLCLTDLQMHPCSRARIPFHAASQPTCWRPHGALRITGAQQ